MNSTENELLGRYLGKRIAKIRKSKGITRKNSAEMLGIPVRTLGAYERGELCCDTMLLIKMAKLYDVTYEKLTGFSRIVGGLREKREEGSDKYFDFSCLDNC